MFSTKVGTIYHSLTYRTMLIELTQTLRKSHVVLMYNKLSHNSRCLQNLFIPEYHQESYNSQKPESCLKILHNWLSVRGKFEKFQQIVVIKNKHKKVKFTFVKISAIIKCLTNSSSLSLKVAVIKISLEHHDYCYLIVGVIDHFIGKYFKLTMYPLLMSSIKRCKKKG